MKAVEYSKEIFEKVVYQNVPFSLAVKNQWKFKKVDLNEKNIATSLAGCALRHYLIFELRIKEFFKEPKNHIFSICCLSLANSFFMKKVDQKEFDLLVDKFFSEKDKEIYAIFFDNFIHTEHLIPDSISSNSVEFLTYRYNTPLWLIKMWNKHYGLNVLYKILKTNSRPGDVYVRSLFNEPLENKDFERIEDNLFKYVGKENLKKHPLYETKHLYSCSLGINDIFKKVDIDPIRGIAVYSSYNNNLLLDIVSKTSKYVKLDFIAPTFTSLYENKKFVDTYGFENVKLYEAGASSLITCLSQKVHTLFVLPNSTRFSLLKNTPDYFLRIDQQKLDSLLIEEKEVLDESAPFVEDNGYLIYCIDTISQKEGHHTIENFLEEHSDFSLIEEKQIFGFGSSSCMYYAILLKGQSND